MTESFAHLVLDRVTAVYGETIAVESLSLDVGRGELVGLLGPSGCGKTTTLRMVAGLVTPSSGRILLDGQDVSGVPAHQRNIGMVFQSYALFPHFTVIENVAFGLRMRHVPRTERRMRAMAALELVELGGFGQRYPAQLSGGQQQRVALARALVIEPTLLLLDERLSNLDASLRAEMRDQIRALQQRLSITTLFVTHDQEEALALSTRVAVLDRGQLVEVGTPQGLSDHPAHPFTAAFLGARTVIEGRASGGEFRAPGLACAGAPEGATRIILRAARLRLDAESGPLRLDGRVASVTFVGDAFETDVDTEAGRVRILVPSLTPPPPVGAACRISAMPGGASFIR